MAYRPQPGNTDADRNLISNIHARGIRAEDAATRILDLAAKMMEVECSGTRLGISAPMLGKDHLDHD
jgi:ethanolamine ammonia-lyase small subunit